MFSVPALVPHLDQPRESHTSENRHGPRLLPSLECRLVPGLIFISHAYVLASWAHN